MQLVKSLYLLTQGDKETVDTYVRNLNSHFNTSMAFGASPRVHQGLVDNLLATADWVGDTNAIQQAEIERARTETTESMKAAMLISGADKWRFRGLKSDLAKEYLLGSNRYPEKTEKAMNLLTNYRRAPRAQGRGQVQHDGVAFIQ